MKKTFITLLLIGLATSAHSQEYLKRTIKDKFYTTTLDILLDTLSSQLKLNFIFDRTQMSQLQVVDNFSSESLKTALTRVCKQHGLYYSAEMAGNIYIMGRPDEISRLKQLYNSKTTLILDSVPPARVLLAEEKVKNLLFNLSGKAVDNLTGESLPGAVVKVEHTRIATTTNVDGYFTLLKVPSDTCLISVTHTGYRKEYVRLNEQNIKKQLEVGLLPINNVLNEVLITGKREGVMTSDVRDVSVLRITPSKLDELPNIGERDIMRSFQLMPGISASNESSSGAYVRGGTPDQNLVLFDGFTVYQVDHLYGFFSAFNTNAVKDVQMYKGGFSAKYGGRLSSVTDIQGKEGNKKETNIGGDLSLLSLNLYGESPLGEKSSVLFSFRKSYQGPLYNKLFNKFNNSSEPAQSQPQGPGGGGPGGGPGGGRGFGTPADESQITSYFYDFNGKYTYSPTQNDKFSLSFYSGTDKLDNGRDVNIPSGLAQSFGGLNIVDLTSYGNVGSSFKWSRKWSDKVYSNSLVSFSTYFSNRERSTEATITDAAGAESTVKNGTFENNDLKDFSAKTDWEWQAADNFRVSYGAFASRVTIAYSFSQSDTSKLIDQNNTGLTGGTYGEVEFEKNKLRITPGIRISYYNVTGQPYIEPRLSGSYTLTDRFTIKGSTGKFYQFANRVIREDILSGSRDFWVMANDKGIPVGSAWHFIAGTSYETKNFLFSAEGYYKRLDGLTEYSLRIQGGGGRGPGARTASLEENFYNGIGYTRGIELLAQKKAGKYTGWLSYTWGQAFNKFDVYNDDYFPASQDVRHEFKSINMYHYRRWNFAATWIFASGRPYTAPLGSYTINTAGGNTQSYLTISSKNGERLPSYHRLDASIMYDFIKINTRKVGSLGLSLFNIYNRTNLWYKEYELQNNSFIISNINYLGFTPNLTLSIKWK